MIFGEKSGKVKIHIAESVIEESDKEAAKNNASNNA